MQAPKIDKRGYEDIVEQLNRLAQEKSGWRPPGAGQTDAGLALMQICARFAEQVIDRLNRAPEKNFLAFLKLIGARLLPARPAQVPLTFRLAANSPVAAVVPARTQVAAALQEGEEEEVIFETECELIVTRAQLAAVYVRNPEADSYSDRTDAASAAIDQPFAIFSGDRPIPHRLYLACDELLSQPGTKTLTITVQSTDARQWRDWPISWTYWDGQVWQPAQNSELEVTRNRWRVTLSSLPELPPIEINGITAGWLRLQSELPMATGKQAPDLEAITMSLVGDLPPLAPDLAFFNTTTLDLGKDFYPFGEQPRYNDTFYIALPKALALPNTSVTLNVQMTNPKGSGDRPVKSVYPEGNAKIIWEVWTGRAWSKCEDSAGQIDHFRANGDVTLPIPDTIATVAVNGEERYWLRARLTDGHYGELAKYVKSKDEKDNVVYELQEATYAPPLIKSIKFNPPNTVQSETPLSACLSDNDFIYNDHTVATAPDNKESFIPFRLTKDNEPALYLGFDQPFESRPMTLYLQLDSPRSEEVAADRLARSDPAMLPQLRWEYSARDGWKSLAVADETQTLSRRGLVHFIGPEDFRADSHFGRTLYWLRLRWHQGDFVLAPRLRRVRLNTTWAAQVMTIDDEILGSGNGEPGQTFYTAQTPVQPGQRVLIREPELPAAAEREALMAAEGADAVKVIEDATGQPDEIWLRWHAVADFYDSSPHDRHYTVDALSGEIRFGDGRYGRIPPEGQNNIRITYRSGGGEQGNRPTETIVQLNSSVPYVDGVSNHEPATGGAAQESIERAKSRGPKALRHRDRAVTAQDLEDLALEASADVARARAYTPRFRPFDLWFDGATSDTEDHQVVDAGRTGVIVVANDNTARPTPSLNLLRQVREHLQARYPVTAELWVAGPEWIEMAVTVTVVPVSLELANSVGGRVHIALQRFLHPLTGNVHGRGWEFAHKPHRSALYTLLEAVEGVDHVRSLAVAYHPQTADPTRKERLKNRLERRLNETDDRSASEQELQRWLDRALIYSGEHTITVAW